MKSDHGSSETEADRIPKARAGSIVGGQAGIHAGGHHLTPMLLSLMSLVFLCGVVAGTLSLRFFGQRSPPIGRTESIFLEKFSRDFDLSPRQRKQLQFILEDREGRKRALMETYLKSLPESKQARFRQVDASADRRIPAILSEKQRKKYNELLR